MIPMIHLLLADMTPEQLARTAGFIFGFVIAAILTVYYFKKRR